MYTSGEGPLDGMIESLFADAEMPPKEVKGVSQEFLDGECHPWRQWVGAGEGVLRISLMQSKITIADELVV